ncbi:ubiquitin 3 binding protein But2 C-terminal domain-containing protein [Talaromyces proteolyticus]|uniref:Ubiquitin 3 binding protein But2 C-terminal domain-containing protein n=1 Tax=Talaromyces proteolyticus TaxID=1131652 RepID=A0AAD4PZX1_9EURO|nr:ubiquitin 3 binding protein But2 C-terminal domain-containing protein [Talaromyces proteolyticus]KAH8700234.1 ubiquitin 3 binding protein But2 C-terminal domain-containing protein [Talaromyces proteolyticus]
MKTVFAVTACIATANALVTQNATCCFNMTVSGTSSGRLGQIDDGQTRLGNSTLASQFCIDSSGGITDAKHRGCFFTPPTSQLQCDEGAHPIPGFAIDSSGRLHHNTSTDFIACQSGQEDQLNIYTNPAPSDVSKCQNITLEANNCKSTGPSPNAPAAPGAPGITPATPGGPVAPGAPAPPSGPGYKFDHSTPGSFPPPPRPPGGQGPPPPIGPPSSPSGTGCPTNLTAGHYEFPHLIIPIDSSSPSSTPGTSFNGTVTSTISSIFNFDIPSELFGKQCSLVFLFPTQDKLETSSFSFSGNGAIDFAQLQSPASIQTSASNAPAVKTNYGITVVSPGHSYSITNFSCPGGQTIAFELKNAGSTNIDWFEDYNPSPIGLYITTC